MTLRAEKLVKIYSKRKVVDQLSLKVDRGQVIGLLGPNGAGKTTTFYMIIGFISAVSGQVFLDGEQVTNLPFFQRARRGIGYLPQDPSAFVRATVEQNLDLVLEGVAGNNDRKLTKEKLLDEFNLASIRKRVAAGLSSGERRRLEIARALATSPSHILLDEPFSGIDPLSVADLQEQIAGLKERGIGVVVTDHNVRDTLSITDYTYLLNEGRTIAHGTPDEVLADPLARKFYFGTRFQT